jgi:hypothetical protein
MNRKSIFMVTILILLAIIGAFFLVSFALSNLFNFQDSPSQSLLTTSNSTVASTISSSCTTTICLHATASFTIYINYSGSWQVSYQGYNSQVQQYPTNDSGVFSGSGSTTRTETVTGNINNGLSLCATAKKQDSSNQTLSLTVDQSPSQKLSSTIGSVTVCGGVVP